MGIAVGIDLGTTYSAVAMVDQQTGRARIIPNADGDAVTPSVIAIKPGNQVLFGAEAKEQQELGYTETAEFFKRAMGQEGFSLSLCGRQYTPVDLSALLLHGLVQQAEEVSGETIDSAYVTVPAYFRNSEREATLQAARKAGLNVLGLLNEPTAAAFAYGLNGKDSHQTVLIYDLGGGTFDVTLAEIDGDEIRILGSDGSHILGGKDWDDAVSRWIIDQFQEEYGEDLTEDPEQLAQIAVLAENAKKRLSKAAYADIVVSYHGHCGKYRLDRQTFDDITSYMLQETSDIVDRLFASMNPPRTWANVDGAILVGGSTRMQQVHEYIERMSGKPPLSGVNVDEAVALGAAIRANQNANGQARPAMLLGSGSASGKPSMLLGGRKIIDATTHALGMISESEDRERYVTDILIPKNSVIPATNTQRRELRVPRSGGEMEVYLLQGSEPAPLNNEVAGKYVFTDIPYVGNGSTLIDVTYSYDDNGVINVSAVQTETSQQLAMHRKPVPDDMSWVLRSPKDNDQDNGMMPVGGEIYLFIDMSGSMAGNSIEAAIQAAHGFAHQIDLSVFSVGLIGFGSRTKGFLQASDNASQVGNAIDDIRRRFAAYECGGGTNNPLGILPQIFSPDAVAKVAVILTDGSWGGQSEAIRDAENAWNMGIQTVGVGIGSANERFLRQISSLKDLSGLTELSNLSASFSKIARVISIGGSGLTR